MTPWKPSTISGIVKVLVVAAVEGCVVADEVDFLHRLRHVGVRFLHGDDLRQAANLLKRRGLDVHARAGGNVVDDNRQAGVFSAISV